jgi:large subunit ribosomal protein L17
MRHGRVGRHLKRSGGHRQAMYRTLMTELFRNEKITTTEAKARAIRPLAEKLVTKARKGRADRLISLAKESKKDTLRAWFSLKRAEQLIELAEKGEDKALEQMAHQMALHARRQVLAVLTDKDIAHKLVDEIALRFEERPGGYTRMFKLGLRHGDASPMALLELVE